MRTIIKIIDEKIYVQSDKKIDVFIVDNESAEEAFMCPSNTKCAIKQIDDKYRITPENWGNPIFAYKL